MTGEWVWESCPGLEPRELVVSTLGVMYSAEAEELETASVASDGLPGENLAPAPATGGGQEEETGETRLQKALQHSITPAAALSYMVFVLLYFPCIATFVAIKQESGGDGMGHFLGSVHHRTCVDNGIHSLPGGTVVLMTFTIFASRIQKRR